MKRIKKLSIISLMAIFLVLSIGCLLLFSEPNTVFATTTTYFSDEKYTSNDYLLLPDGTKSSKKIGEYAAEITAADYGTTFDDLGQIIPLQYLNSTISEATFKYYGEEYGFYVVKEGEYFDVLIIDFVYEFEDVTHTDAEYKVRIKPILQANFERKTKDDGTYTWEKLIPQRYTYYVANPRFIMTVKNENERNAGDVGYNVDTDNGLNITQARVNYSDLSYMDEQDLEVEMIRFECQLMFDFALAYFDEATEGAASFVFTLKRQGIFTNKAVKRQSK